MSHSINLQEINPDGAVAEAHEAALDGLPKGDTRATFLRKSAIAGGAAVSGGALLGALAPSALAAGGGRPPKSFGKGDIGILNYALTLEYLEAAFYNGASAAKLSLSAQGAAFLATVTKDENAHVAFLKTALGAKAAKEPAFDFKGANTSAEMFMKTAQVLENTGVHAYSGQALNIKNPAVREGRALDPHDRGAPRERDRPAERRGRAAGKEIAPNGPFDTPLTAAQVLTAVKGTGFIV